jgi:hypothetical protein
MNQSVLDSQWETLKVARDPPTTNRKMLNAALMSRPDVWPQWGQRNTSDAHSREWSLEQPPHVWLVYISEPITSVFPSRAHLALSSCRNE